MPSPRPRILGSSRVRNRDADRDKNPQSPSAPVTIQNLDEPDCEIIKIDDDVAEIEPSRSSNSSVTIEVSRERSRRIGAVELVEQFPMRLQEKFNVSSTQSVVAPISPSLALQFVPDTSTSGATHARNIYSRQNVVMVLPVNTVSSQVFKAPTLCTLERIDNPTEITQIKQVVATRTGNLVTPTNDSDARTMKARRDAQNELRKQILQEIFKNDTTDKTKTSNASSPISWRNKKEGSEKFNNRANSSRNVDSFKIARISNSVSKGSSFTGSGSMDIREVFVAESSKPTSTLRLVNRTDSRSPLRGRPAIEKFLGDRSVAVSQSNAPSSRVDASDIEECFISVSNNSVGKSAVSGWTISNCLSKEAESSTSSTEKRNGAYSKLREHTNSERPVPPLTIIADKTKLYEEPIELISLSQESSDDVCFLENIETSMYEPQKTADSVLTLKNKNQSISAPQKPFKSVVTSTNKKRAIPDVKEVIVSIIPLNVEKDENSSARSKDPTIVDHSSTTTALQSTELSSQSDKPSSSRDEIDKNANEDPKVTIECSSSELADSAPRKPRCTACKQRFFNRTELHRHATLSHQGVRIVFCDICSDSFLTDRQLQQHRLADGDCERDDETLETPMADEDDVSSPNSKKEESIPNKEASAKCGRPVKRPRASSETSPGLSSFPNETPRGRSRKKIIVNDGKMFSPIERPGGRPRKKIVINDGKMFSPSGRPGGRPRKKIVINDEKMFSPNERPGGQPRTKIIVDDEKSDDRPELRSVRTDPNGVEKRKPQTKNKTVVVTRSYVEEDVVKHSAAAASQKFKSSEIKKLVVPLTRLEGATLDKYLEKLATRPVVSFGGERPTRRENFPRKVGRPKGSTRQAMRIFNVRRSQRKRWPSTNTIFTAAQRAAAKKRYLEGGDSDSDSDDTPSSNDDARKNKKNMYVDLTTEINSVDSEGNTCPDSASVNIVSNTDWMKTEKEETLRSLKSLEEKSTEPSCSSDKAENVPNSVESDVIANGRKIIRKLTSRSSAASVVALEANRTSGASRNLINVSNNREEKSRTTRIVQDSSVSEEKSSMQSDRLEESIPNLDDVDNDEATKNNESIEDEDECQREEKSIEPYIFPRRTYMPRKCNSKVAKKLTQEGRGAKRNATKVKDMCRMCDELLKKLLADQFGGKNIRRTSLACPCCDMHFISMFYLEKHIARNHLRCKSEPHCGRLKKSVDVKLQCETETVHHPEDSDEARPRKAKGSSRSTKIKRILESSSKRPRAARKQDLRRTIDENRVENLSDVQCWVCDLNFDDLSKCNFHMRKVHGISKSPVKNGRFTRSAKTSESARSVGKAVYSPKPKLNVKDQTTVDREYLLKQLLSDDSTDGLDEHEDSTLGDISREVTVEMDAKNINGSSGKKVIGLMSSAHTCRVCSKEFHRTQDLLMHSLTHETEDEPVDEESKLRKLARAEKSPLRLSQQLFVDPSTNDDRMDVESDPEYESKIDDDRSSCETTNERRPLGEDFFASNAELDSDDFAVFGFDEAPERPVIGEKRSATILKKNPKNSTNRKPSKPSLKKPRCDKIAPSVSQQNTESGCSLKEFLDTEKSLANADVTSVNDRVPIECGKCNRQFPSRSALNEHLFFLHDDSLKDTVLTDVLKTEEKSVRRWRCKSCRQDFKQLQGYGRHRYRIHGDESMVHVCENCCKILTTVTMVNVHICTDVASYNCRTCDKTFSTGMSLRLHNTEKHMEADEPNICEPCNKRFLTKSMLLRHEKSRHRFLRPYRPRKRSPVMMAEHGDVDGEETSDLTLPGSENSTALYSDGDEDDGLDLRLKKNHRRSSTRSKFSGPNENGCESSNKTNSRNSLLRAAEKSKDTTKYIDEREFHQCSLCRIYCLTKAALDSHVEKIHSGARKVCQLCRKIYAVGGLMRHAVDEHISPCETLGTYEENNDSVWNVGTDIEVLVRTLGMKRLMSMWDYRVSDESAKETSMDCSACEMNFSSRHLYRFHVFMHHDTMCVLCNIEFKSGEDAAKHKKEEHRSASCYIWFVDRILRDLTAVKDFQKVVERSFIEMISRDSADSDEENRDFFDPPFETKEPKFLEDCSNNIMKVENKEETEPEENPTFPEDVKVEEASDDNEDKKIMLVVTDEDLDKYDIGKRYPNIWGLASKISSTCEEFTPKDVKEVLETYFEN